MDFGTSKVLILNRKNLEIITKATVVKIIFEGKKAVGLEYMHKGKKRKITAHKEVILSAGSLMSPAILQRSGVGASEAGPLVSSVPVERGSAPGWDQMTRMHMG